MSMPAGLALTTGQFDAQIGVQHAPGGQHRGGDRHDDSFHTQFAGDGGDMQAGGAAKGEHRVAARIDAAAHRRDTHAVGHAGIDQAMDAARRLRDGQAKPVGEALHRRRRRITIQRRCGHRENSPDRESPVPGWHR